MGGRGAAPPGGTGGGPIVKDKAFFFGSFEKLNETRGVNFDLSKIPEDPKNPLGAEEASPGFIKNLRKVYPDIPLDLFPARKN